MTIRPELRDELLKECSDPREVLAEGGLIKQLTKAIVEGCLETGLAIHLGYPKHGRRTEGRVNTRNGTSRKKLKGSQGEIEIAVPRDREASFEPQLIQKHQTRLEGFEEKILALYARGMTTRDIQAQVQELYGPEAIETLYPQTRVQLCMVHLVRNSLKYVSYKHRKEVAADLKLIYSAATEGEAQVYLELCADEFGRTKSNTVKQEQWYCERGKRLHRGDNERERDLRTTSTIP